MVVSSHVSVQLSTHLCDYPICELCTYCSVFSSVFVSVFVSVQLWQRNRKSQFKPLTVLQSHPTMMKLNELLLDKDSRRNIESFVQRDEQKNQPNRNEIANSPKTPARIRSIQEGLCVFSWYIVSMKTRWGWLLMQSRCGLLGTVAQTDALSQLGVCIHQSARPLFFLERGRVWGTTCSQSLCGPLEVGWGGRRPMYNVPLINNNLLVV